MTCEEKRQEGGNKKRENFFLLTILCHRLSQVFCEYPRLFLVLEFVSGGELFERIVTQEYFSESSARDLIKEALSILCYLHGDARVVHRDLKPENFIMTSGP
jgi:calcium-dependent protein kinase